jgi:hypothetical protein
MGAEGFPRTSVLAGHRIGDPLVAGRSTVQIFTSVNGIGHIHLDGEIISA